jgi:methionine-S-sulfoxide reductase
MHTQTIVLGGGCFWCLEAVYERVRGVISVTSGYAGGTERDANYYRVSSGKTNHAEVVEIVFDADVILLQTLLDIFWTIHDPTTKDRQGADVGPQYRSAIFYTNDEQKEIIDDSIKKVQDIFDHPIVTEVVLLDAFYKAEISHQDYYNQNKNSNGYCRVVIDPKIRKFMEQFGVLAS